MKPMPRDTVIGRCDRNDVWLTKAGGWTDNLFAAEKFDGNSAAVMAEDMKKHGTQACTELVWVVTMKLRADMALAEKQKGTTIEPI